MGYKGFQKRHRLLMDVGSTPILGILKYSYGYTTLAVIDTTKKQENELKKFRKTAKAVIAEDKILLKKLAKR